MKRFIQISPFRAKWGVLFALDGPPRLTKKPTAPHNPADKQTKPFLLFSRRLAFNGPNYKERGNPCEALVNPIQPLAGFLKIQNKPNS